MTKVTQPQQTLLHSLTSAANNAYRGTSFDPEKRGATALAQYENELTTDLHMIAPAGEDTCKEYESKYKRFLGAYFSAQSRVMSTMITGPANFPTARMEKYRNWERSAWEKFTEWREAALKAITKKIENQKPQEIKDAESWEITRKTILSSAKTIIEIDTGVNTYTSRQLIVNSITGLIKRIAENGRPETVRKCLELVKEINAKNKKPIVTDRHAIWGMAETAQKIADENAARAQQENKTFDFPGGQVVLNFEANRVQIIYDSKPDYETIQRLKKNGCKWAPSNKAWQLFLHNVAITKARALTGIEIPYL